MKMKLKKISDGNHAQYTALLDTIDSENHFKQDIAEALCFATLFTGSKTTMNTIEVPLGYLPSEEIAFQRANELQQSLTQLIDYFERHLLFHHAIDHMSTHSTK